MGSKPKANRYEFQDVALDKLPGLLSRHKNVLAVAPTGAGKTVVGAKLIARLSPRRVVWLVHGIELIEQAYNQLVKQLLASEVGMLSGTIVVNSDARVLVASVDMFRGSREVPNCDLLVIDEAHRSVAKTYQRVIDESGCIHVLGLTATPCRLDGKGLDDTYNHLFVMAGPTELIAAGAIARPITYGIPESRAKEMVRGVSSGNGDYAQAQLGKAMSKRKLVGDVVAECARLAPHAATIVFAVNRAHGRVLHEMFLQSGRTAEYLDGLTPRAEREGIIERLRTGETEVVVNIDVLSEGFDCPAVKCVAIARPTKSLTRFLQYVGRASRPYRGTKPIVIDAVGNCWRKTFGLPEIERQWSLAGNDGVDGVAPLRLCPKCGAMVHAAVAKCPECGADIPRDESEVEEERVALERLEMSRKQRAEMVARLRGLAKVKNVGEEWVQAVANHVFGSAA